MVFAIIKKKEIQHVPDLVPPFPSDILGPHWYLLLDYSIVCA